MRDPRIPIDSMHDPEILEPVANLLRAWGIPAFVENTGGGCFCIVVGCEDGYSSLLTPDEEDARRWMISLDAPDGEYLGVFYTEYITMDRLPLAAEVAEVVRPILRRFHDARSTRLRSLVS